MADLPETRNSLLLRLKNRSSDSWSEFLAIYEKSIVAFARRKGLQEADAKDVCQEVLSAVENKLASWDFDPSKGKFRGWLFRVARNIAVDKIIGLSRGPKSGGTRIDEIIATYPDCLEHETSLFLQDYRRQLMHWAASQIRPTVSESSWLAFCCSALEGLDAREIAEKLNMTPGNVYAAKFRITSRIKKLVKQFEDEAMIEVLPQVQPENEE